MFTFSNVNSKSTRNRETEFRLVRNCFALPYMIYGGLANKPEQYPTAWAVVNHRGLFSSKAMKCE